MSLRSAVESLANSSFSSKCSAGREAFNDIDYYLRGLGRDGLSAMDAALYICITVFKADYNFSDTEIQFMAEVSGNTGIQKSEWINRIIPEIRRDSEGYIARRIRELEEAPLNIRRSAILLAALAAVCDHDLSYYETSEIESWTNRLHCYFND